MKQFFRRSAAKVATLMLASLMLTIVAFAQKRITGKVVGSDGKPVAGATIQVKGSNTGTSTLEDGSFSITVPQNATLQISATGTKSQDVKVGSLSEINVTLATTLSNLEEVVVTGYTAQRKKDITGAVASVHSDPTTHCSLWMVFSFLQLLTSIHQTSKQCRY